MLGELFVWLYDHYFNLSLEKQNIQTKKFFCPAFDVANSALKQNTALLSYVSQCVSHRRDISPLLKNLMVKAM